MGRHFDLELDLSLTFHSTIVTTSKAITLRNELIIISFIILKLDFNPDFKVNPFEPGTMSRTVSVEKLRCGMPSTSHNGVLLAIDPAAFLF